MWDQTLIESGKHELTRKRWISLPVSAIAHAAVVGIVIGLSFWTVEGVPPAPSREPYWSVKVHLGPPPALIEHRKTIPSNTASQPARIEPIASQPEIADATKSTGDENATGESATESRFGSIHGVEGGVPDGQGFVEGSDVGTAQEKPIVISAEVQQPVLIKKITPVYPPIALRGRVQGVVMLQAVISKTGTVEEVVVLRSTSPLLTQAAVAAVSQWRYKPAILQGRAVRVYFNVTVEFRIQ